MTLSNLSDQICIFWVRAMCGGNKFDNTQKLLSPLWSFPKVKSILYMTKIVRKVHIDLQNVLNVGKKKPHSISNKQQLGQERSFATETNKIRQVHPFRQIHPSPVVWIVRFSNLLVILVKQALTSERNNTVCFSTWIKRRRFWQSLAHKKCCSRSYQNSQVNKF